MNLKKVPAAQAKAQLSDLVARAAYGKERIVIEKRGKPTAALVSMEDLQFLELYRANPRPPRGGLALVGLWRDVGDDVLDELVEDIYRSREEDLGRPVNLEE